MQTYMKNRKDGFFSRLTHRLKTLSDLESPEISKRKSPD
jgi:hypothetical protein